MLHAVVMAGGSGTRFWPESRAARPKQLLKLVGERTMIQATVDRVAELVPPERVMIVTNERLAPAVAEQLPQLSAESIVSEPCRRDTAPCIGLAAGLIAAKDPEATMVVLPADHVITPDAEFHRAIRCAADLIAAEPGRLVTFGIRPTYPAESFGYIERAALLDTGDKLAPPVYQVEQFREKPTADVARGYLETGNFYWNSGIFVWRAATVLEALATCDPAMTAELEKIVSTAGTPEFDAALAKHFAAIEGRSIDYAVMEPASDSDDYEVLVVEAPYTWDDVGSWLALARMKDSDDSGNVIDGMHLGIDTKGCVIRGDEEHLIATLGVEDLIIVHTPDATLIADKKNEESVRRLVEAMREANLDQYL